MVVVNAKFWGESANWPRDGYRDGAKFVFLAAGMKAIGSALFTGEWTGKEPNTFLVPLLPALQEFASLKQQAMARMLLHISFTLDPHSGRYVPELSDAEWDKAVQLASEANVSTAAAFKRWHQVQQAVREFLAQGLLPYVLRYPSGQFTERQPPALWNADDAELRFRQCHMRVAAGSSVLPIFVPAASLDTLLADIAANLKLAAEPAPTPATNVVDDETALARVHALVTGENMTVWKAAFAVAEGMPGKRESVRARLHSKFKAKWPALVRPKAPDGA